MAGTQVKGANGAKSAAWRKMFSNPLGRRVTNSDESSVVKGPLADDSINAVIEGEIIPRLLMAHSIEKTRLAPAKASEINPSDAQKFAELPMELEAANLMEEVDNFLAAGVSVDAILVDLLAPAARTLGEMWERDECDFVDVTMGLWRLQEVMREVGMRAPPRPTNDHGKQRVAIFTPMPGDQHNFGALMIDEVFSRAGWDSEALAKPERRDLLDRLGRKSYDLVGLTLSRDCPSASVTNLIVAMRSVSANPNITVFVGGRVVNDDPSIVSKVGADGTGADARTALEEADKLVASELVRAR
uniref:cobalamin B12-binding domain-containing protein n=1 Tax=uncultured Erythrobacter sp. TaxID=263913 RepID=UPI002630C974|nr:cobalamin B12-binding domain-containing protein [uncultured Erythrobacter sp.]